MATVTVRGTIDAADAGLAITVYDGAHSWSNDDGDGGRQLEFAGVTLAAGANSLTAQATDAAGSTGTSVAFTATLATTPPTLTVSGISPDTGTSASDGLTDVATVTVSGTISTPGGTPACRFPSTTARRCSGRRRRTRAVTGVSAGVTLVAGVNSLTAQATDAAGNIGTSAAFVATLDTTPPTSPWRSAGSRRTAARVRRMG